MRHQSADIDRLFPERRGHDSGLMGMLRMRRPVASRTAFATAAAPGIAGGSPMPLAP